MRKDELCGLLLIALVGALLVGFGIGMRTRVIERGEWKQEIETNLSTLASPDSQRCEFCDRVIFERHNLWLYRETYGDESPLALLFDDERPTVGGWVRVISEGKVICTPCFSKGLSYLAPKFYEMVGEKEEEDATIGYLKPRLTLDDDTQESMFTINAEEKQDEDDLVLMYVFLDLDKSCFQYKGKEYKDFGELIRGIVEEEKKVYELKLDGGQITLGFGDECDFCGKSREDSPYTMAEDGLIQEGDGILVMSDVNIGNMFGICGECAGKPIDELILIYEEKSKGISIIDISG